MCVASVRGAGKCPPFARFDKVSNGCGSKIGRNPGKWKHLRSPSGLILSHTRIRAKMELLPVKLYA